MKIILIGAGGAVGKTALQTLNPRHEVITVGRTSGDILADIEHVDNIRAMYKQIGKVDAVVCSIGDGHFGPLKGMTGQQLMLSINRKMLPQVSLVLEGLDNVNDRGSFTLTTGVLNRDPIVGGAAAAAANGAVDGFVKAAAVDMPRGIRINAVSPEVLEASREKYDGFFRGHRHVSNEEVGLAYSKSVEGVLNGQVFIVE
ncbi:MAG: short chain dehydrogenase [Gammaproteobacteria bacterium]|nr:short chain dehydrogenase [Gammaproteobacteria bacterium]